MNKSIITLTLALGFALTSHAQLQVWMKARGTPPPSNIVVQTNEAILVSVAAFNACSITYSDTTWTGWIGADVRHPVLIAGPAIISTSTTGEGNMIFRRLKGSFGMFWLQPLSTNTITVPAHKICRLYRTSGSLYPRLLTSDGEIAGGINETETAGVELPGGASLLAFNSSGSAMAHMGYALLDDFDQNPSVGTTVESVGSALIEIEQSSNLTNWNTVYNSQLNNEKASFYRFKVTR